MTDQNLTPQMPPTSPSIRNKTSVHPFAISAVVFAAISSAIAMWANIPSEYAAPFVLVALATFAFACWLDLKGKDRLDGAKRIADILWSIWSGFGVMVLFYALVSGVNLVIGSSEAKISVEGVLGSWGPALATVAFVLIFGTACARVALAFAEWRQWRRDRNCKDANKAKQTAAPDA